MKTVSAWGNGTVYNVRYNIFDGERDAVGQTEQSPSNGTLVQVYDATKDERTDYILGPNGALARIKRKAGTDSVTFIHADHLGTVRAGTSATGALAFEDFHTPFGESLLHPDATDDQGDYTGHIRDRQTGLSYMQARYQDPLIGRFLSIDPMTMMDANMNPGMFNRYAYAMNDPINMLDPTGECSEGASDSKIVCAVEDFLREEILVPVITKAMEAAGIEVLPEDQQDPDGIYTHEAADNSLGEEFVAFHAQAAEAGVESRNPFAKKKGKCCFVAGTLVETEDGLRPINEIDIGDRVLARNPLTGETTLKAVTDLISQNERVIWAVVVTGENDETEAFETTDDHPWWIVDKDGNGSWKTTDVLVSGMSVTTADNQTLTIKGVTETESKDYTYNLTVADFETYFVGKQKILVHNCSDQDPNASSGGAEHTTNQTPSNRAKHEKSTAAKKRSRGGESGDSGRRPPRKRPDNWKGPWPPK